jgi:hypothetical protein
MAKQQTPIASIEWNPGKGGLIADIDPKNMPNGGLFTTIPESGGLNIRSLGASTGVSPDYEQIIGNSLLATLDPVVAQTKQFRINVDTLTKTIDSDLDFKLQTPDGTTGGTVSVSFAAAANLATCLSTIKTAIDLLTGFLPTSTTTTTGATTGYVTFEFDSPRYIDFRLFEFEVTGDITISYEIIREAIDEGMTGEWNLIGSTNQTGDCLMMFTTKLGDTKSVVVSNCVNNAGLIQVTTTTDHNLVSNETITITGVLGTIEANGIWSVTVIDATNITLQNSAFTNAYTGGGVLQYDVIGYGEIGVVYRTSATQITYTRLLRSREFNFSTFYQIDARSGRKNDGRIAAYFTDNNNPYRVFYYKGAYVTDGSISTGQYIYGTIDAALQLNPFSEGIKIDFVTQLQSGGSVRSGNKRYAVRFLTESFAPTSWTDLTNPIPVYSYNNQSGPFVEGDEENIVTPKINVLKVTNPVPGVFTYCEVAVVEYVGIAVQASIIGRYSLNGEATQFINHTGNEVDSTDLDAGSLVEVQNLIEKGRNVEILDNRLILSNLTPATFPDFTDFAKTFNYSLEVENLEPVGIRTATPDADMQVGEYQDVNNYYSKLSHMRYETYRYFIRMRMRNTGLITPAFYLGYDIKIDLPLVNPPRRDVGSFTSFDLTDTFVGSPPQTLPPFATKTKSIYIDFHSFDLDFQIDGRAVRELADEIDFVRAKVVPTVLYNAMSVMGVHGAVGPGGGVAAGYWLTYDFASTGCIGPFPFVSGTNWFTPGILPAIGGDYPAYSTYPGGRVRKAQFHIAPDLFLNGTAVNFQPGDQIINFGNPKTQAVGNFDMLKTFQEFYEEYNGATGHSDNTTIETLVIDDAKPMANGTPFLIVGGQHFSTNLGWGAGFTPSERYPFWDTMAVLTTTDGNNVNMYTNTDYGFYDVLYYRPKADQYGSPEDNICETTGVSLTIGNLTGVIPSGTVKVFGDVCTQRSYIKHRYPNSSATGFGGGLGFYTQNRVNSQMFRKPTPSSPNIFPEQGQGLWLTKSEPIDPRLNYNAGYTYQNGVTSSRTYDANANYQTDWGNALVWSNPQGAGSNTDSLRIFLPNNIKFLEFKDGYITDARNINNELITVQQRNTLRQFFNSTSIFTTTEGSETVLGDGAVMNRQGTTMTKFGSDHKWSVFVGRSERGFDVLYFIDWQNKAACRLGYNGNDTLEEINGMKSFFANNLQWVWNEDKPANGEGIAAVFNQRYREAMWTLRGWKKGVAEWVGDSLYNTGDPVEYGMSTGFENVPNFYIALTDNTGSQPDLNPTDWAQVPYTDSNYYNLYTIVFSEFKNQFQSFHSPKPLIYALFENGYIVPRPISNTSQLYLANTGNLCEWFDDGSTSLTADAHFDAVINQPPGRKNFLNIIAESDQAITEITCTTPTGVSFTPASDAKQREGNEWVVPIRWSTTPRADMYGDWAIFRFRMSRTLYNKVNSFYCRLRAYVARVINS